MEISNLIASTRNHQRDEFTVEVGFAFGNENFIERFIVKPNADGEPYGEQYCPQPDVTLAYFEDDEFGPLVVIYKGDDTTEEILSTNEFLI